MFPSLELAALVDKDQEEHEGSVYFWLVQSVHQEEDKTVLPEDKEMIDASVAQALQYIDRLWERRQG
jgi:hypothetical protein